MVVWRQIQVGSARDVDARAEATCSNFLSPGLRLPKTEFIGRYTTFSRSEKPRSKPRKKIGGSQLGLRPIKQKIMKRQAAQKPFQGICTGLPCQLECHDFCYTLHSNPALERIVVRLGATDYFQDILTVRSLVDEVKDGQDSERARED
jgi:hypothetical protein